jgi:hypothetical protein
MIIEKHRYPNMRTLLRKALAMVALVLVFTGCKKEEEPEAPAPADPVPAVITTVVLTFTDPETSEVFEMRSVDTDGDGGNAPTITADALPGGRAYSLTVTVLDQAQSPTVDVTPRILAQAAEHQFFFAVQAAALTISYSDQDPGGRPVGLTNLAITGAAGSGTLTVTLRQGPDKEAAGVAAGDMTNAGGETKAEVVFPVIIG